MLSISFNSISQEENQTFNEIAFKNSFMKFNLNSLDAKFTACEYSQEYCQISGYDIVFSYDLLNKSFVQSLRLRVNYIITKNLDKLIYHAQELNPLNEENIKYNDLIITFSYSYNLAPKIILGFDVDLYNTIINTEYSLVFSCFFNKDKLTLTLP